VIRINLLTGARTPFRLSALIPPQHRGTAWGLLLLVLTGIGVAIWWRGLVLETAVLDAKIVRSQSELLRLTNESKSVERAMARKAELASTIALIHRLRAAQKAPVILLAALSRSVPDGLWFTSLGQQADVVQIDGRAMSLTSVTDFVDRLRDSGAFARSVAVVSTGMELVDDSRVIRFSVKAQALGTSSKGD
jgi:Tfp pilus assembly protein PilN